MFCRLNEYWCKQAVMWWRLGRWRHFVIAQIAFRDFVFFHIRSEVKMEFTAQNTHLSLVRKHMNESEGFVFTCTTVKTLVINLQNSYQRECQRVGTTGHVTSLTATLSDCIQTVLQGGHANTSQLCQVLLKNILLLAGNMNAFFMTNRLNKSTYAWWWEEFKLLFILTQQRSDSVTPLPEKTEKRGVRENRLVINRAVMHKLSGPAL